MMQRWRSPESLLLPIGEALAKFACDEDFADVKACEGPGCTLFFADRTGRRARRWCSMAICGNRAKQAAHRNRLRKRPQRRGRSTHSSTQGTGLTHPVLHAASGRL